MIKILYLIDTWIKSERNGFHGGAEKHLLSLVQNLDQDTFQTNVLQLGEGGLVVPYEGCLHRSNVTKRYPVPSFWGWPGLVAVGKLKSLICKSGFDVVHVYFQKSETLAVLAALGLPVPLLASRRDMGWRVSVFERGVDFFRRRRVTCSTPI